SALLSRTHAIVCSKMTESSGVSLTATGASCGGATSAVRAAVSVSAASSPGAHAAANTSAKSGNIGRYRTLREPPVRTARHPRVADAPVAGADAWLAKSPGTRSAAISICCAAAHTPRATSYSFGPGGTMLPTVRRTNGWSSVPDTFNLRREMQELFDAVNWPRTSGENVIWAPAINVRENDEQVIVEAELPGVRAEDVDISVENGMLTITGEKRADQEKKEENWHIVERRYGRFERSFTLARAVDLENIHATFNDGVLRIEL